MTTLNRKVLQLNAHYQPDGVISVIRAFNLVYKGKAEIEQLDDTCTLKTSTREFRVPSIIRLVKYRDVYTRRRASGKQRLRIFIRDKFRCQYCSIRFPASELTLDHIMPRSRDGEDEAENLATSCKPCNQRKGNRTPDEARMPLLATPSALRYGLDRQLLHHYAESRPEWRWYLFLDNDGDVKVA